MQKVEGSLQTSRTHRNLYILDILDLLDRQADEQIERQIDKQID